MNQEQYLKSLREALEERKVPMVEEILADYQEHFAHALQSGKTESEIVEKLGLPDLIAKAYEAEAFINQKKSLDKGIQWGLVANSIGRLFIIAPFNFFFLIIPGIFVGSLLFAGWVVSLALASVGLFFFGLLQGVLVSAGTIWATVAALFMGLGFVGVAALGMMIMYTLTKYVALAVINYLQWNIKFIVSK